MPKWIPQACSKNDFIIINVSMNNMAQVRWCKAWNFFPIIGNSDIGEPFTVEYHMRHFSQQERIFRRNQMSFFVFQGYVIPISAFLFTIEDLPRIFTDYGNTAITIVWKSILHIVF